jgi:hypothetical protein
MIAPVRRAVAGSAAAGILLLGAGTTAHADPSPLPTWPSYARGVCHLSGTIGFHYFGGGTWNVSVRAAGVCGSTGQGIPSISLDASANFTDTDCPNTAMPMEVLADILSTGIGADGADEQWLSFAQSPGRSVGGTGLAYVTGASYWWGYQDMGGAAASPALTVCPPTWPTATNRYSSDAITLTLSSPD